MHHDLPLADPALDRLAPLPHGITLCYRCYGHAQHPPLVLIAGLGLQLVSWPMAFIRGLVQQGWYVITLDNRDMGRSTHMPSPPPARWRLLLGHLPAHHYQLADMASDVAALLDHLHCPSAHILGMSMGGMIAQCMAVQYPHKLRSLTSIFSTTGSRRVGQPAPATLRRMLLTRPAQTLEQAQDKYVRAMRHIGNPEVPGIESVWRNYIAQAWQRDTLESIRSGYERQVAAILRAGDRTAALRRIRTPTLVLHGDRDAMVHPSGGYATAQAIPGAQLHIVPGMRHQIDAAITPQLLDYIVPHLQAAQAHGDLQGLPRP